MPSRLIWITDAAQRGREEERLHRVFESAPVDLIVIGPAEFNCDALLPHDIFVIDNAEQPVMAACARALLKVFPASAILLRTTCSLLSLDFNGAQVLDGHEGLELAKSRILAAMPLQMRGVVSVRHPAAETVPEWRRNLIGQSRGIQKVAEVIRLVGPRRCTVLITGETGTGKEVVARSIHLAGPRSTAPFVALNCSALPAALLEAELFGHTRGAFTGAVQQRTGRFEQAQGGTLFLDEIGDMPLELQAKLLRVLQEREFQRLGSSETIRVDARVVAATNLNLRQLVAEGAFREDLYYRLNVVPLELPPLRAHMSDLRVLTEHFLCKVCSEEQMPMKKVAPHVWATLEAYDWPGNVRQLENTISSAVILSEDRPYLEAEDFSLPRSSPGFGEAGHPESFALPEHGLDFTETVNAIERSLLLQALRKTGGNKKAAAEMLRLKRTTLSAKVRVLDIGQQVA